MAGKGTIFVVDDDNHARSLVEMILKSKGYNAVCCINGQDALDKLKTTIPNLVLLDIMMPGLNGYDVLKAMKENPKTENIPVIMLTAKGQGDEIMEGYQHGADYYIPKPFTTEQLIYGISLYLP
ncbi:response regulator [bacterium]|nr:response regulator [bacterium]